MSKIRFDVDHVDLWINFNTQSEQKDSFNNTHVLTIYFDIDVDIVIGGLVSLDLFVIIISYILYNYIIIY